VNGQLASYRSPATAAVQALSRGDRNGPAVVENARAGVREGCDVTAYTADIDFESGSSQPLGAVLAIGGEAGCGRAEDGANLEAFADAIGPDDRGWSGGGERSGRLRLVGLKLVGLDNHHPAGDQRRSGAATALGR
jgi:hypothetical protein